MNYTCMQLELITTLSSTLSFQNPTLYSTEIGKPSPPPGAKRKCTARPLGCLILEGKANPYCPLLNFK